MTKLTDDQRSYLRNLTVDQDVLRDWSFQSISAMRVEMLALGLVVNDFGWIMITDEGLRALDTVTARRILRARHA